MPIAHVKVTLKHGDWHKNIAVLLKSPSGSTSFTHGKWEMPVWAGHALLAIGPEGNYKFTEGTMQFRCVDPETGSEVWCFTLLNVNLSRFSTREKNPNDPKPNGWVKIHKTFNGSFDHTLHSWVRKKVV